MGRTGLSAIVRAAEAFSATGVPIAVAPAALQFSSAADAEGIHVFRLEPLEPLVLHRGTWHWGPFPVSAPAVRLFNVQGLRYAEDNACVDLAARGLDVDVLLS